MNWLDELRAACAKLGQKEIARRIGYSSAVVSQVLHEKYPGDLGRVQACVEGVLMKRVVDCPTLGEITLNVCHGHQARKFSTTNPMRVQMYRACRCQCPHSTLCKEV